MARRTKKRKSTSDEPAELLDSFIFKFGTKLLLAGMVIGAYLTLAN